MEIQTDTSEVGEQCRHVARQGTASKVQGDETMRENLTRRETLLNVLGLAAVAGVVGSARQAEAGTPKHYGPGYSCCEQSAFTYSSPGTQYALVQFNGLPSNGLHSGYELITEVNGVYKFQFRQGGGNLVDVQKALVLATIRDGRGGFVIAAYTEGTTTVVVETLDLNKAQTQRAFQVVLHFA